MKLLIGLALFCVLLASAAAADTAVAFFSLHIGAPSPPPPPAPVITFPAPSVAYIYPAAASSPLVNLVATVTTGTFAAGGGAFSSSDCAAQDILVSPNGNVQVAGPSNLTGSTSCTATAAYPGAVSVSQTLNVIGTQQTIASVLPCPFPSQQTGPGCQYNFAAEATTQVLGAVPTPMTSGGISFADGSGTIGLGAGSQCSSFSISGGNLLITAPTAGEYDCTYVITDSSAVSVSPVPIVAIATAAAGPLTIAVSPSTITLSCNAAPGTIAAFLSASGGNGAAITYSMSGSDASWTINGLNQVVVASGGIISGDCTSAPISYTMSAIQSGSTTSTATLAITASPPSSLTVANRLVVSGAAAQSQTNYPMQFGRPFVEGDIPHSPQVLLNGVPAAYSQADVKNRYPDGSVEFAVISTIIPAISPSDCSISNTNPTEMPAYALWAAHNNLPVFNVPQNPTQDPLQNVLYNTNCHHIDGNGARTMISTENTTRASNVGGQAGFTEEPPYPAPSGTRGVMFSAFVCNGVSWCPTLSVGCDEEYGCLWGPITPTASGDAVEAVTAAGGGTNSPTLIYFNGALVTPNPAWPPPPPSSTTPTEPYQTQGTLTWGADGDHVPAFETGVIISDQIFTTDTMSGTTVAAVSAAINAFYATPGSASPVECSMANVHCSVALSTTHRMVAGATKAFMLYNVSGKTTQDIGFDSHGATDVAAALTFCGSVANCRYQTIYDQTAEVVPGPTTITFQDTATPNNTPQSLASMQALLPIGTTTLTLTPNTGSATGSPDAAVMLANGNYTLWTSGPVAQTIMLADDSAMASYDVGFGDGYKPFRPRYYATFWPAIGKVFVRLVGENGNSIQQEDLKYKISVADGYTADLSGTQVTNKKFHWVNSRWTHTFWVGGAGSYQGPCDVVTGGCAEAYSVTRAMTSAYSGNLFQLIRLSDNATLNVGQTSGHVVDPSGVSAFCQGTYCLYYQVYGQINGNAWHAPVKATEGGLTPAYCTTQALCSPIWWIDPETGLPAVRTPYPVGFIGPHASAGIPGGTHAISMMMDARNDAFTSCCGQFLVGHYASQPDTIGSIFGMQYSYDSPTAQFIECTTNFTFCSGGEYEEQHDYADYGSSLGDEIQMISWDGASATNTVNDYVNGTLILSVSPPAANCGTGSLPACKNGGATGAGINLTSGTQTSLGFGGDNSHSDTIFREGFITNGVLSTGDEAAARVNMTTFYGAHNPATCRSTADMSYYFGENFGDNPVGSSTLAVGLRQMRASQTGPIVDLRDVVTNTVNTYGPASSGCGLDPAAATFCSANGCAVAKLYNQGTFSTSTSSNTYDTTLSFTAASTAAQPTVTFNSLNGLPTMHFSGSQMLCTGTLPNLTLANDPMGYSVVARHTVSSGVGAAVSHIYSGSGSFFSLGWTSTANQFGYEINSGGGYTFTDTVASSDGHWQQMGWEATNRSAQPVAAYLNNSTIGTNANVGDSGTGFRSGPICLGGESGTANFNGDIAEFIVSMPKAPTSVGFSTLEPTIFSLDATAWGTLPN